MNIDQLMKWPVHTCRSDDSLDYVAQLMWEGDCGCVPVVDGAGRLLAMITDRDICMAAHFQGGPLRALKVKDAMSKRVFACRPSDTIGVAENIMRSNQVRRLPIVDENDHVVGILSLTDIAAEADAGAGAKKRGIKLNAVGQTLSAIGRRGDDDLVVAV
jgi:CBS domain-containing protein